MANSSRQTAPTRPLLLVGLKRSRADFEMPSRPDMSRYSVRGNDFGRHHLHAAYGEIPDTLQGDRGHYVNMQHVSSYHSREDYWRGQHVKSPHNQDHPSVSSFADVGVGAVRPRPQPQVTLPLADQSSTLFVEGLPAECTRREVSHIFRPFVGFEDIRLVKRKPRLPGGQMLTLCFVEFFYPAQAAAAMDTLQGIRTFGILNLERGRGAQASSLFAPLNYA